MHMKLKPLMIPPAAPKTQISVYVSPVNWSYLQGACEVFKLAPVDAVVRLAYAFQDHRDRVVPPKPEKKPELEIDRIQRLMLAEIEDGLKAKQICLAEASTGSGKSRVLAKATASILERDKKAVVWVAAPTISVLRQLVDEFRQQNVADTFGVLLGRQQFVSERRTREVITDCREEGTVNPAELDAAEGWLAGGAPVVTSPTKALAKHCPALAYLAEDLTHIAPSLPLSECILQDRSDRDQEEPACEVLATLNENAETSKVVFVTHAMLILRTARIPHEGPLPFTHLVCDEAHSLESTAASHCSYELSLRTLRSWVRSSGINAAGQLVESITGLITALRQDSRIKDGFGVHENVARRIRSAVSDWKPLLDRSKRGDREELAKMMSSIKHIESAQDHHLGLSFSPVIRMPSIQAGPGSVRGTLDGIWSRIQGGVLVSATVFIPDTGGMLSSNFLAGKLALPVGRTRPIGPYVGSWVTATPVLCLPAIKDRDILSYPKDVVSDDDADEVEGTQHAASHSASSEAFDRWADAVAKSIVHAAKTAVGGTLVLSPAYRDIRSMATRLNLSLERRLIVHKPDVPFSAQRQSFEEMSRAGKRPVWIATGAAWTGLNLRDEGVAPAKDILLTDLMVIRAPVRMNRSSTHFMRLRRMGWYAELAESGILLRQGIGRLIRAQGLKDRRLWILDGRILEGTTRTGSLKPLGLVLNDYRNRRDFSLAA